MTEGTIVRNPETEIEGISRSYSEFVVSGKWRRHRSQAYFDYRANWVDFPARHHISAYPLDLDIEVTSRCNLDCPMCWRTDRLRKDLFGPVEDMDLGLYRKIIDEAGQGGVSAVKLCLLGEPLMHPDIVEIVRYAKQRGIVDVIFNTNGVLLTEQMGHDLLEAGVDGVFISFDSDDRSTYEKIRIGASFESVVHNVAALYRLRNSSPRYAHVQIRVSKVVFPHEGQDDVDRFIRFWQDKVDAVGFNTYMKPSESGSEVIGPCACCDMIWQRMSVMTNGDVLPCCSVNLPLYVLGNLREQSVFELWHGERMTRLREAHLAGRMREIPMCATCDYIKTRKIV